MTNRKAFRVSAVGDDGIAAGMSTVYYGATEVEAREYAVGVFGEDVIVQVEELPAVDVGVPDDATLFEWATQQAGNIPDEMRSPANVNA